MKRFIGFLVFLMLSNLAAATSVFDHFRASSNAYDFGVCNAMLVLHDLTEDGRPEILLSHFEHRVGGVHIWHVYSPQENGNGRYLGNVDFHPRGLRVFPGVPGFLTYEGEFFGKWRFDAKGLYLDGQVKLDGTQTEAVPFWVQRCPDDGDSFWAGADDATMSDVDLDLEVVSGADELAEAAGLGDLARMRSLLDDGVDMYAAENAGGKALLAAATAGRTDSLQFLFARSDSHPDAVFRQAIRAAAGVGHEAALQEILEQDLGDARSALVQEALGAAAQGGKSNAVTMLIAAGGDANAQTSEWEPKSPLELAAESKHDNVVEAFRSTGVDVQRAGVVALFDAIYKGDEETVRRLINEGVSTESGRPGNYPTPALIWSINSRQPEITLALLELGADVNVATPHGDTPLIEAAGYGYLDIVIALLDRGADVGATNHIRVGALAGAATYGNADIVRTLLDLVKNDLPENALDRGLVFAAHGGYSDVICMLLTAGADLNWENELQRSAEVTATMARKLDVVELLQNWESTCLSLPASGSLKR